MSAKLLSKWFLDTDPHAEGCGCDECQFRFSMTEEQTILFLARAGLSPEDTTKGLQRQLELIRLKRVEEATRGIA